MLSLAFVVSASIMKSVTTLSESRFLSFLQVSGMLFTEKNISISFVKFMIKAPVCLIKTYRYLFLNLFQISFSLTECNSIGNILTNSLVHLLKHKV